MYDLGVGDLVSGGLRVAEGQVYKGCIDVSHVLISILSIFYIGIGGRTVPVWRYRRRIPWPSSTLGRQSGSTA